MVYLDNVIFHRLQRRLSDRNYWCRRRPRCLIFSQFSIYVVAKMRLPPGLCPDPAWGLPAPQLANVGSHHCRGPHRIAGPRAPRPHDPPLRQVTHLPPVWDILLILAYTPDRRDQRRLVSHPKDTGNVGVNEFVKVSKRHSNH